MSFLSFDPLAFLIKNRRKFITPISVWGWTLSSPGDSEHEKKNQKGHPYQTPASTLNRDGGYEPPAIFNHLLSRDYFTAQK